MRFVIRTDAFRASGAGHVMRTSVIAEELITRGHQVIYVGEFDEVPWVRNYLSSINIEINDDVKNRYKHFTKNDTLIIDSYQISPKDEFINQFNWHRIVALVDKQTPPYQSHLYIHTGPEISWMPPNNSKQSRFLNGTDFILIRKSLKKISKKPRNLQSKKRILITGGGSDPFNFCSATVSKLEKIPKDFSAFILSDEFPIQRNDSRFKFINFGDKFESYIPDFDVVVTTSGTSSWEFHYLRIPVALACAVGNQSHNYQYQIANQMAMNLGFRDLTGNWQLNNQILNLVTESNLSELNFTFSNRIVIDGYGANRIVDEIQRLY